MRFRNETDDALVVPALGVTVEPGGLTPELSSAEGAGFEGQDGVWKKATAKQAAATSEGQG